MILIDLDNKTDRQLLVLLAHAVNEITERLDKMNGKCSMHDNRIRSVEDWQGSTHNERLRTLEDWRNKLLGVGLAAIITIPVLTALAVKIFVP